MVDLFQSLFPDKRKSDKTQYERITLNKWAKRDTLPRDLTSLDSQLLDSVTPALTDPQKLLESLAKSKERLPGPKKRLPLDQRPKWSNQEVNSFIEGWLVNPEMYDLDCCDVVSVLANLQPYIVSAWEHSRENERIALLNLKVLLEAQLKD